VDNTIEQQERKPGGRPRQMYGAVITVGLRMTHEQRAKLAALGGAAWVRGQIDRAELKTKAIADGP